jgi:hypothetical protein
VTKKKPANIPNAIKPKYDAVVALTDSVCADHLNEEYAELARKLAAKLARKRPSPLVRGRENIWACGIVSALGFVNFLHDPQNEPHLSPDELCEAFGVKRATGDNKGATIRKMFKMYRLDPDWCLPSQIGRNPMVWMLEVNGLILDMRYVPRPLQEEAFRKGMIPYIPADGPEGGD